MKNKSWGIKTLLRLVQSVVRGPQASAASTWKIENDSPCRHLSLQETIMKVCDWLLLGKGHWLHWDLREYDEAHLGGAHGPSFPRKSRTLSSLCCSSFFRPWVTDVSYDNCSCRTCNDAWWFLHIWHVPWRNLCRGHLWQLFRAISITWAPPLTTFY